MLAAWQPSAFKFRSVAAALPKAPKGGLKRGLWKHRGSRDQHAPPGPDTLALLTPIRQVFILCPKAGIEGRVTSTTVRPQAPAIDRRLSWQPGGVGAVSEDGTQQGGRHALGVFRQPSGPSAGNCASGCPRWAAHLPAECPSGRPRRFRGPPRRALAADFAAAAAAAGFCAGSRTSYPSS